MSTQTDECDLKPKGLCVCVSVTQIVDSSCYSFFFYTHTYTHEKVCGGGEKIAGDRSVLLIFSPSLLEWVDIWNRALEQIMVISLFLIVVRGKESRKRRREDERRQTLNIFKDYTCLPFHFWLPHFGWMGLDCRRWKRTQQKWLVHMCAQRKIWKQPFGVSAANRVSAVLLSGSRSLYILNKSIFRSAGCLAASPPTPFTFCC